MRKVKSKVDDSGLDEFFYARFFSVKGFEVDILTVLGAQFPLTVQDRSLKRGEAPVQGVVSSDTNLHPRPALLFVRVGVPVFAHFLIRSRKTGRPADLLAEATPVGALLSSQFCRPPPAAFAGGSLCNRSGAGDCTGCESSSDVKERVRPRQRSGGGASAPSGLLLFLVALYVAPLERFEGGHGVGSLFVETIFPEQGYNEPEELGRGGHDILAVALLPELALEEATPDLGHDPGGLFGHLVDDSSQPGIADLAHPPFAFVFSGVGDAYVRAGELLDLFEVGEAGGPPRLRGKLGSQVFVDVGDRVDDLESRILLSAGDHRQLHSLELGLGPPERLDPAVQDDAEGLFLALDRDPDGGWGPLLQLLQRRHPVTAS